MVELIYIPNNLVNKVWSVVESDVQNALNRSGNYANSDHFKSWCLNGKCQLWILWDKTVDSANRYYGVVITEIVKRPLYRICNIRIMVGKDRLQWQHHIKKIEDFAIKQRCDKMELIARPGWERVLKEFNYIKSHVVLDKYLKENKCPVQEQVEINQQ